MKLEPFKKFLLSGIRQGVSSIVLLQELRSLGYGGTLRTLQRYLKDHKVNMHTTSQQMKEWMHLVLQDAKTNIQVKQDIGINLTGDEVVTLMKCIKTKPIKLRNRALTLLAHANGISPGLIASFLCITSNTTRAYINSLREGGIECVLDLSRKKIKKANDPVNSASVFSLMHAPPNDFGFNRTTWRMDDLYIILKQQGVKISRANIRKFIKNAGCRFRKAKKVLTSTDPEYRAKLQKITQILTNLKSDEKFFSVDEFGPFAINVKEGRSLVKRGETRVIPQWQKSKGSLMVTAALELSTNQISHFYSENKNTDEMIRMLDLLIIQYSGQSRIFFSWDAASWHGSKKFMLHVREINEMNYRAEHLSPIVELAPLPSSAQFLNVIESIFSGMARAIIHNSDYASTEITKTAIDRYFAERNDNFQKYPRRAGHNIWGKERVEPEFKETNNCKDPQPMRCQAGNWYFAPLRRLTWPAADCLAATAGAAGRAARVQYFIKEVCVQ